MGRVTKMPIKRGTYEIPAPGGPVGWIEDKKKSWVLFYDADGGAIFFPKRDKTGATVGQGIPSQPGKAKP